MRALVHTATLEVQGVEIRMASSYSVDIDLLQPADGFRLTVPLDARTVSLIPLDAEFDFSIDNQPIVTGFVDRITETKPTTDSKSPADAGPAAWSTSRWTARDFRSRRARAWSMPSSAWSAAGIVVSSFKRPCRTGMPARSTLPHRVKCEAGMVRQEALDRILEPLRLVSWADGRKSTLVIGQPNYRQAPAFNFVYGGPVSNVLGMRPHAQHREPVSRLRGRRDIGRGQPPGHGAR